MTKPSFLPFDDNSACSSYQIFLTGLSGPLSVFGMFSLLLKELTLQVLSGVRLHDGRDLKLFILIGWDRSFRLLLGPPGLNRLSSFA